MTHTQTYGPYEILVLDMARLEGPFSCHGFHTLFWDAPTWSSSKILSKGEEALCYALPYLNSYATFV